MTETTLEKLKKILAIQTKVSPEEIPDAANFSEDLDFDSLDSIEFIMSVEEAFDIEVTDQEAIQMKTLSEAVAAVDAKLKP